MPPSAIRAPRRLPRGLLCAACGLCRHPLPGRRLAGREWPPFTSCPLSPQASFSSSLPPTLSLLPCSHEAAPPPLTRQSLAWLPRAPHRPCWVPFRWADSGERPVPLPRSSRDTVFLFRRSHCEGDFRVLIPSPDSRSESRLPSRPVAWGSLPFTVTSSDFISPTSL